MNWILFSSQALNVDTFARFHVENTILFGIAVSGPKIPVKEYGDHQAARNGLAELFTLIDMRSKKVEGVHDPSE